jgi:hypothetical protein
MGPLVDFHPGSVTLATVVARLNSKPRPGLNFRFYLSGGDVYLSVDGAPGQAIDLEEYSRVSGCLKPGEVIR